MVGAADEDERLGETPHGFAVDRAFIHSGKLQGAKRQWRRVSRRRGCGRRLRPDDCVDDGRGKQQGPGDGRRAPVTGADAHHHQNKAHQRANRRDGERDLEIAMLLAGTPLQHEERCIHHGEHEQQKEHGRRGELGDGAEERERHGDEEEREDGDMRRAPFGMNVAEAERQEALMRHAVDQARGGDVIDERGVGDGKAGYANRAVIRTLQNQKAEARKDFETAFKLDPGLRESFKKFLERLK